MPNSPIPRRGTALTANVSGGSSKESRTRQETRLRSIKTQQDQFANSQEFYRTDLEDAPLRHGAYDRGEHSTQANEEHSSERKRREQEQNALLALAMALRVGNGRDDILLAILQQSARSVGAPVAAFVSYDAARGELHIEGAYHHGDPIYYASIPLPAEPGISSLVLQTGEPYFTDDVITDNRFHLRDLIGDERAAACLPLIANGEPLGVLWVFRLQSYLPEELRLLTAIAEMAADALHRAKLHDTVTRYTIDLEAEVAKRTKELAAANDQLMELDRLKSKFVSDVTHELRTPVTNIGLYLKLLERKPEKLAEYIPILLGQAERLRILVKDTLDLSRMDQSREMLNLVPVDLNLVTQCVVAANLARAEEESLALDYIPAPTLPLIRGDYEKLTQVITNLVTNALNYTPNGQVTVRTFVILDDRVVGCEVKDTGCGIYIDDLPHLFDRFYRGKRDQMAPVPGTGLGLSIVKEIVELHGGRIHVSSEVGFGSTFTVYFPLPHQTSRN